MQVSGSLSPKIFCGRQSRLECIQITEENEKMKFEFLEYSFGISNLFKEFVCLTTGTSKPSLEELIIGFREF